MKTQRKTGLLMFLLFVCFFAGSRNSSAAGNVYRVDRYGELNYYSGSPVVAIRSNISAIDESAFNSVKTTRFVTSGNPYFKTVDGALLSKDGTLLIRCPSEKQGSFTVPSSVKKIEDCAFKNCTKLIRITIPDSVVSIGEDAFENCSLLRQIRLSNHITQIKDGCFSSCSSLRDVKIPASVTSIGRRAFSNCQSLTGIVLPDSVSEAGGACFENCIKLKSAKLSSKMSKVSGRMFYDCTSLKEVKNTGNIETVESRAFKNCVSLKTFSISGKMDSIQSEAFQNCVNLGTVVIPRGTEYISYRAFTGAAGKFIVDSSNPNYSSRSGLLLDEKGGRLIQAPVAMTGELRIPGSVGYIADSALRNTRYSSIIIPEGVTAISKSQFKGCEKLKAIYLPASIGRIGGARRTTNSLDMNGLEKVVVAKGNQNYQSKDGVVYSADGRQMVFFPSGKRGAFHLSDECKHIGNQMQENKLTSIHVSSQNKYFTASDGVLYNLKGTQIRCFPMKKANYKIPKAVKDISYLNRIKDGLKCKAVKVSAGNKDFYSKAGVIFEADSDTLLFYPTKKKGAYKIPSSTRYVASDAFSEAHELTSLTITKNVSRRQGSTLRFRNCRKLKKVVVNQGQLNYISMNFLGCRRLSSLSFPSTIMTTDLNNLPEGVTIHGWKNTYAKEAAEDAKGKFISLGTIPNVITGIRVKKIIDKYQLSWNASGEASGYQVYTVYNTIKNISGAGNTSCYINDIYKYDTIYIRAYKIVNNKKVYGKAKAIYVGY